MVGADSSHGVSRVVQHKDYYLRGGDMTVLVENHLYRIHSYFFERESLFFRQKFSGSNSGSEAERGSTDSNAYTLEDIKSEDFARFLWVFYNPKYSVYEAPLDTWLSILKLANRWTFDSVKELSVRELEKIEIEPVEKIAIYHNNSISRLYLIPSYVAVCKRDKPLTFTEGMSLGMETVLRIAEARERLRQQAAESCMRTPTFEDFEDAEVEVLIREIFQLGSRPTSPVPATAHPNGVNGSTNGTTIKLNPAPPGNPPKANGAPASRANGGSAADPKSSSLDPMRSIDSVISPQASSTATPAPAPAPATTTQETATQEPRPRASLAQTQTGSTPSPSPVQAPPVPGKANDNKGTASQGTNNVSSFLSSVGAGKPSSSVESNQGLGSHDVSITVVPPSSTEHSNDVTAESNDNVNDAEKDESSKDNDTASVFSDAEAGKNKQSGKGKGRVAKSTAASGRGKK